jgi:hypothetical protein
MIHHIKSCYLGSLCQALNPAGVHEVVWEKRFHDEDMTISMRPLSLPSDESTIRELAALELPERTELAEMLFKTKRNELSLLALSDFGQSFLGMVDDHPAFLVTVHCIWQHVVADRYPALYGDYKLCVERLSVIGGRISNVYAFAIWQSCAEFLLEFPEVKRLVAALDIFRPSEKQYCRAAGFRSLPQTGGSILEELYCR